MSLSKRNRRGLLGLILICLFIAITPRILSAMFSVDEPIISFEEAQKIHEDLSIKKNYSKKQKAHYSKSRYTIPRSKFNPKEYDLKNWMFLGLSEKQAAIVLKFTVRGIANEEELKRIFVLPDELVKLIKDSIIYTPKEYSRANKELVAERKIEIIDINKCNEIELQDLPGIGPYYAKKIVEYREQLGGYHSTSQLLEIWKFESELYDKISPFISCSNTNKKLDINKASLEELKAHPYISYGISNSIVKMRAQSRFKTIEDVKRSKLIDEEFFDKIKAYLECK